MKYLKNQKGSALVVTLILLMLVTILGSAMLISVVSEIKMNRAIEQTTIARYLAQAGIDHGLYMIESESELLSYPYNQEVVLGNRSRVYHMLITKSGPIIRVNSTGTIEVDGIVKQQVFIEATVQEDGKVTIQE